MHTTQEYFEIPFLKFIKVKLDDKIPGISHVIRLDRLKQTSVQVSFTRQEPLDIDSVLLTDEETTEFAVKRQSISINNINTTIIPGVELYGEGLLFILDDNKLRNWSKHEEVLKRTKVIAQNTYSSDRKFLHAKHKEITAEFILIHTLSHLIIKELEYKCGYSTSSLQERLYIGEGMNGFMILAIEGSEGSLGGLVSQSDDLDNLNNLIQSALKRAEDCSSDPVCYNSDGQGVSNLNLAACHACTLLPETACEEFNVFLDRCLLIDQDYGYFNFERTKR